MCHVSRVTCHLSHVTCHMSPVTCHMFYLFIYFYFFSLKKKLQSGGASRWRVCYQRGLPRLVFPRFSLCRDSSPPAPAQVASRRWLARIYSRHESIVWGVRVTTDEMWDIYIQLSTFQEWQMLGP